uniref:DUF3511 domain protein n=1 Tax=Davidia involucrata TaxID=16924 RepID=A0A5B6YVX6_DAVIN
MGDYRSKSYGDGRMQMEGYYGHRPTSNSHDFRSYSASYSSSYAPPPPPTQMGGVKGLKSKKGKNTIGSSSKSWSLNDPEFQRKKRVASYKVYSVEGRVKGSLRKSFRWLKDRYTQVVYGWS